MAQQSHSTDKTRLQFNSKFIKKKPITSRSKLALFLGAFFVFLATFIYPNDAKASLMSMMAGFFSTPADASEVIAQNSQNVKLLKAALNVDPNATKVDQLPVIVDDSSLLAEVDPTGYGTSTLEVFDSSQITIYVVRSGDTLPQIAKTFGVTTKTIMIANDMTSQTIKEGQRLLILPVSGVQHTVKSGETILGIAKIYKVTTQDILKYNHFENNSLITVGDKIFIPSDAIAVSGGSAGSAVTSAVKNLASTVGYFIKPLVHYKKTQGLHGHNGVDLGASVGEPIHAAAAGQVLISRMGWNGGYGNYVVIQHSNGMQTLYAHASKLLVSEGQSVTQGQNIALVGSTGESTGPHLHVEVRGGKNPF